METRTEASILARLNLDVFAVIPEVYSDREIRALIEVIDAAVLSEDGVMRSQQRYAIRRILQQVPDLKLIAMNPMCLRIVNECLSNDPFVTKSIWFEKPPGGNWFVGWHQDISISVSRRAEVPGYSRWTAKHGVVGVVPPIPILERTLTIRIHLDDADGENGAVRVMPCSHRSGIVAPPLNDEGSVTCAVPRGGVMLMRPLLLHASSRSISNRPRRVLHIELNDMDLEGGLEWAEQSSLL